MPFIALSKSTGERIDITTIENPRARLAAHECLCQLCGEPMTIKAGMIVRAHFAHRRVCTSDYRAHPEGHMHRAAKLFLRENLGREFSEYAGAMLELEVKVPEANRIADLMATFPNGWRIAHEVQLASITTEELQQRTDDYANAGVDVVWWLGKSANTHANRLWCYKTFGYILLLQISDTASVIEEAYSMDG